MNDIGIYKIINSITGKVYIGSSTNLSKRFHQHMRDLKLNKHFNQHLQNSFNKYNEGVFYFEIIEHCDKNNLPDREEYYMKTNNSLNDDYGYNINPCCSRPPSWKGKTHTLETKDKISESNKGKIISEYARKVASKVHKGKTLSEEHLAVLKERFKGGKNPMYGKTFYDVWLNKYGKIIADEKYNSWLINKQKAGRKLKGDNNPSCKIKDKDIPLILEKIKNGISIKAIAKEYNVSTYPIYNIKNGKRKPQTK